MDLNNIVSFKMNSKTFNEELFIELKINDYVYVVRKKYRTPQVFKVLEKTSNEEIIVSDEIDEIQINVKSYNISFYEGSLLIVET